MTPEEVLTWARAIERLLITATATLAIWMAWNLFRVGIVDPQAAELATKGWSVKLQKCGPGIFFALFGTVVLAYALQQPLKIPQGGLGSGSPEVISYFAKGNEKTSKELSKSISRLVAVLEQSKAAQTGGRADQISEDATSRAIAKLQEFQQAIIANQFGTVAVKDLDTKLKTYRDHPEQLSQDERQTMEEVSDWLTPSA